MTQTQIGVTTTDEHGLDTFVAFTPDEVEELRCALTARLGILAGTLAPRDGGHKPSNELIDDINRRGFLVAGLSSHVRLVQHPDTEPDT